MLNPYVHNYFKSIQIILTIFFSLICLLVRGVHEVEPENFVTPEDNQDIIYIYKDGPMKNSNTEDKKYVKVQKKSKE